MAISIQRHVLGIDIGSVAAGLVVIAPDQCIVHSDYRFHGGAGSIGKVLTIIAVFIKHDQPEFFTAHREDGAGLAVTPAGRGHKGYLVVIAELRFYDRWG